jgi:hypothetical protein
MYHVYSLPATHQDLDVCQQPINSHILSKAANNLADIKNVPVLHILPGG